VREIVQGYNAAAATERKDRAIPLLGIGELIAGVPCAPLTPRRLEWMRAYDSPFICGGEVTPAAMLQFLWFVSPNFSTDKKSKDAFIATNLTLNAEELRDGIESYLDRAFLDARDGKPGKSYVSQWVGFYRGLSSAYGDEWTFEKVGDTPLALIFQLLKENDRYQGETVTNRRSDAVTQRWLDEINQPKPERKMRHGRKK